MPHSLRHDIASLAALAGAGALALPAAASVPPDFDGSCAVDGGDLGALLAQWGPAGPSNPADLNDDGVVDGADVGLLLAAWGDVPARACLQIESVTPTSGGPGTVVVLSGSFPDSELLNYSLTAVNESGTVVPFDILSVSPTSMTAIVGPAPAGVGSATLTIGIGTGTVVAASALPSGFNYAGTAWVWSSSDADVASDVSFDFDVPGGPVSGTFFSILEGGEFALTVSGACVTGTTFDVWFVAKLEPGSPDDSLAAAAVRAPFATLLEDQDALPCASSLGNLVGAALQAQSPTPIQSTFTTQETLDGFILGFELCPFSISSGAFVVQTPQG